MSTETPLTIAIRALETISNKSTDGLAMLTARAALAAIAAKASSPAGIAPDTGWMTEYRGRGWMPCAPDDPENACCWISPDGTTYFVEEMPPDA